MTKGIAQALVVLAGGGCSLGNTVRATCASHTECEAVFGPGSECTMSGFCVGGAGTVNSSTSPPPSPKTPMAPAPCADLENGGFEVVNAKLPEAWSIQPDVDLLTVAFTGDLVPNTNTPFAARSGTAALQLRADDDDVTVRLEQELADCVAPGDQLEVQGWAWAPSRRSLQGDCQISVELSGLNDDGETLSSESSTVLDNNADEDVWLPFSLQQPIPDGASTVRVGLVFALDDCTGAAYFDDLEAAFSTP